tara:strand:+ start:3666 stop:4244 length:579 start_codon:yes stop_codon:yes gene_type:complete
MPKQKPSLVNHKQKILNEMPSNIRMLSPGQIIRFKYNAPSTDPEPMVMTLYLESSRLLHCLNLNFLPENEVQKMFRILASRYGVSQPEVVMGEKLESFSQIDIPQRNSGLKSRIGQQIYDRILKPIFMQNYNCYRTYTINKIGNLRLVEYDMDIVKSGMSRISAREVQDRMKNALGGDVSKKQGGDNNENKL